MRGEFIRVSQETSLSPPSLSQVLPEHMQAFKKHYVYFAPYLKPEATAAMLPEGKDR